MSLNREAFKMFSFSSKSSVQSSKPSNVVSDVKKVEKPSAAPKAKAVPVRRPQPVRRGRKKVAVLKHTHPETQKLHALVRKFRGSSDAKADPRVTALDDESDESMVTSLASSLVSPTSEYEFRLVNSGSITASSGIWAGACKLDPTSAAEWSSFDALFNEYKVVGAKITFLPYFASSGSTELGTVGPFIGVGVNLGAFGTNPTSLPNVFECANSKVMYLMAGGPHEQYTMTTRVNDLQWQAIGSGGTPYAGAYGQFSVYGGDFYSSTNIISYVFELFVRMRARS